MDWDKLIETEKQKDYFKVLEKFVEDERRDKTIYPAPNDVYNAFKMTPFQDVRVVILGQDPYHQPGQAMGLSFSVYPGIPLPKSLRNIYKELEDDLGVTKLTGDLSGWARQGVFLLNTILTVEDSHPLSHQQKGWEHFTNQVISELSQRETPLIFVLWGKAAQDKMAMISKRHLCLCAPHPSPLSAYRGFFGSKPFSTINKQLIEWRQAPIDWSAE